MTIIVELPFWEKLIIFRNLACCESYNDLEAFWTQMWSKLLSTNCSLNDLWEYWVLVLSILVCLDRLEETIVLALQFSKEAVLVSTVRFKNPHD